MADLTGDNQDRGVILIETCLPLLKELGILIARYVSQADFP